MVIKLGKYPIPSGMEVNLYLSPFHNQCTDLVNVDRLAAKFCSARKPSSA